MKPEIQERWVAALRGGVYKKTEGALRVDLPEGGVGYCCLGVLTDLYLKDTGGEWLAPRGGTNTHGVASGLGMERGLLAPEVCEWAGVSGDTARGLRAGKESLVSMNDYGRTDDFTDIADRIEAMGVDDD